jgi:hypothetical protein
VKHCNRSKAAQWRIVDPISASLSAMYPHQMHGYRAKTEEESEVRRAPPEPLNHLKSCQRPELNPVSFRSLRTL